MRNTGSAKGVFFVVVCLLLCSCNSQEVGDYVDDTFLKPDPTSAPFNSDGSMALISTTPAPSLSPSPSLTPTVAAEGPEIEFGWMSGCRVSRDMYCAKTTEEQIDRVSGMNSSEIEEATVQTFSYQPLVSANVNYWTSNATPKEEGWVGYSVVKESVKMQVRALAMGVVITSISKIDTIKGMFEASLKLRFFDISVGPFSTISEAVDAIYKDESKTTLKDSKYYRQYENDMPGAWVGTQVGDNEFVHPDGLCKSSALRSIKPIKADDFSVDLIRLPYLREGVSLPRKVADEAGYLSYVDIIGAGFKFKPINRRFYSFQIDLLDIVFHIGSIDLIDKDQNIAENLMCFHPAYSGFSNHVFGSDKDAGSETSDSMDLIPYLYYDRVEPWLMNQDINEQYSYGPDRQRALIGNGSRLQRKLGLRLIVKQPESKGWYQILPYLFVSFTAVANFVASNPALVGGSSMIQALLGVNSLVTQSTSFVGQKSVLGRCIILAYVINCIWISTVVFMMLINQAKNNNGGEWYILYQNNIFRYLRLLAISLCLLYIPLTTAYSIDKTNGKQMHNALVWGLVIGFIVIVFAITAVADYRIVKARVLKREEDSIKALVFSSKPLILWSEEEVISWINIGSMHNESYFSDSKRISIAEKLEAACIFGKLLLDLVSDAEKLVQFVGLPYGDAIMLADEVTILTGTSTCQHRLEVGTPTQSPGAGVSSLLSA